MSTQNATPETLELDTPQELARALKCTPQCINRWHRQGIIPSVVACGRVVRFDRREVIETLRKRTTEAAADLRGTH